MIIQPEQSVLDFISKCSNEVGKAANDSFNINMWNECIDLPMESPLEKILYCALNAVAKLNDIAGFDSFLIGTKEFFWGFQIRPQVTIDKYRVDFIIDYHKFNRKSETQTCRTVIVECDSQSFHERSEKERRYEKKRDRYFAMQGLTVFHYTGKEILSRPFNIASEIIAYVTGIEQDNLSEDSGIED